MITVPDDFPTIQEAVNNANEDDTIFVRNGTYYENVVVNKTISLVGEDMEATVIDANYTGTAVNVTANYVNVTGFTFQHGENPDPFDPVVKPWSGILIRKANYTHVSGNIIRQNGMWGVYVSRSNNCTVVNNTICENGWFGVDLDFSECCLIDNNTVSGNGVDAFGAMVAVAGGNNTLSNNLFVGNSEGIWISHERYDLIKNNIVRSDSQFNLYLWVSYDCLVLDNVFADCYTGIREGFGGYNMICRNLITNNNIGIRYETEFRVWWYNSLYLNNFVNNTVQAMIPTTKNSTWDDGVKGNYWSDYTGIDLDGDGIGDAPYIVSGDNLDNYPLMEPYSGLHDIGVAIRASKTVAGQGYNTTITLNVTARNHSEQTEICNLTFDMLGTDFEVELNLTGWGSSTFTFALNTTGFTIGNYTLWSSVSPVPSEGDMRDNNRSLTMKVTIPGDISSTSQGVPDGRVDMRDIQYMIIQFNTKPTSPNWNPNADVNDDNTVNMRDIMIAIINFNRHE